MESQVRDNNKDEILIICNSSKLLMAKDFLKEFNKQYSYLNNFSVSFFNEIAYILKDIDKIVLNEPEGAFNIDNRGLIGHVGEPIRLFLSDGFFNYSFNKKVGAILHEIGHLMTNPKLQKIRQYRSEINLKEIKIISHSKYAEYHNDALEYITKLLSLPGEINAELWLYENNPEIFEKRLDMILRVNEESLDNLKNAIPSREFFYSIPKCVYDVSWKSVLLKSIENDKAKEHEKIIDDIWKEFLRLAKASGYSNLEIILKRDEILKASQYKNEDLEKLIKLYEDIFEEFITVSSTFFPPRLKEDFFRFYGIVN